MLIQDHENTAGIQEEKDIHYPTSDGKPMAENTLQFKELVKIKLNLEKATKGKDIFVAGDLLWYPVKGNNTLRVAPDVMVSFGRPKGYRGSYLQWKEADLPPQVVFEILSPGNREKEMRNKLAFYNKYGVEEYYLYDPHKNIFTVYQRKEKDLKRMLGVRRWESNLLGIHFHWTSEKLELFHSDGEPFLTYLELEEQYSEVIEQLREAKKKLRIMGLEKEKAETLAEQEKARAEQEKARADKLAELLRSMGIDPSKI